MKDFRKLESWGRAHRLTVSLYGSTKKFPKDETFGLTSQIRRSAASIGANIAEGCGRKSDADFSRFIQMAMGSASELEYHLLLASDLGLLEKQSYAAAESEVTGIKRMLTGLLNRLKMDKND